MEAENTPKILTTTEVIESAKRELEALALQERVSEAVAELADVATNPLPIGDQDALKIADTARKKAKALRTAIERKRKELKQVALDYGNAVDSTAKAISAPITKQEERLEAAIADLQRREREERERAEREALERFNARVDSLRQFGATFDGQAWGLGKLKIAPERIRQYDEDGWAGNVLPKFEAERARLEEEEAQRREAERILKEQAEELERVKAELAALKAKQAAPAPIEPATEEVVEVTEVFAVRTFEPATPEPATPEPAAETPMPQPETPAEPEPAPEASQSASEIHLASLAKGDAVGVPHFRAGYRAGIDYAKQTVLALLGDTAIKSRADLKAAIEAI